MDGASETHRAGRRTDLTEEEVAASVAIVGMACRFPGADTLERFWSNLENGVESITRFTGEELLAGGVDPALAGHPAFVPAKPRLEGVDLFDAPFFDIPPREAEILDPQHRLFLEIAWEALERAGYAVDRYPGWIGLFAGVSFPSYWVENLARHPELIASVGAFQVFLANDRDYFATRASYELDLKGPSVNVQSACSTSLVAVHLACQSLLDHHCDIALAGGSRVHLPRVNGYLYQEGGIVSPDGHCRSFDARGLGSVFGDGVGAVVLKRLSDALADGDPIDAVIRGSGMNNDGAGKVGYTAPSVDGQAEVIALAQGVAGVDPGTVTYVEAHGSGTPLGDPIEVAALEEAFGRRAERADETGFCALGSVKSNFGHLEAAAGIAGLIKAVLALRHRKIPPSLHCEQPNPRIDWASSPFYVATELEDWRAPDGVPLRAGVSSFGVGGTNVHTVLEEAPAPAPPAPSRERQLLVVSARTATALDAATDRLADRLEALADDDLADAAYTLMTARRRFEHRRAVVCASRREAIEALRSRDPERMQEGVGGAAAGPPVFLLSGLGDHYPGMGLGLHRDEPVFRETIDRAAELLREPLGADLRAILFPEGVEEPSGEGGGLDLRAMLGRGQGSGSGGGASPEAIARLSRVENLHPALFAVEVALARLWASLGVEPAATIGYSLGEYVAACLAGVMSFEDGLRVVAERARLIEERCGEGAMLAVPLTEEASRERIADGPLAVAAVNGPGLTVVAGPAEAVAELEARLAEAGTPGRRLPARHAFHTAAMEPAAGALAEALGRIELRPPETPFVSNVTGAWITDEEATDPGYWARHLTSPVRFADGLETLFGAGHRVFVELGPGQALGSLVHQRPGGPAGDPAAAEAVVVPTLRAGFERRPDLDRLLRSAGRLWLAGVPLHDPADRVPPTSGLWRGEARRRLRLPTYPFERKSYWIDPPSAPAPGTAAGAALGIGAGSGTGSGPGAGGPAGADRPSTLVSVHERPRLGTPYAEPEGELERTLAGVWRRMLGIEKVGAHDDFFELGGNSLLVPQVLFQVREAIGVELPVPALLQAPTVASFARVVERAREGGAAAAMEGGAVDLAEEADLDRHDRHEPAIPERIGPAEGEVLWQEGPEAPEAVFLTGGTGFFGAFLLERLLRETGARVCCLVRAEDEAAGAARLEEALRTYRLWDPELAGRIVPVPGDLARPLMGLPEEAFRRLAGEVEVVYHAGAWVNFTYPYTTLAPGNVGGTVEALRLAATGKPKPFHFVSSIAVFAPGSVGDDGLAHEDAELAATEGLFSGYAETKWVSERLVREAGERGLPVTIHRPGVIGGGSTTGAGNPRDLAWNLLKGCIELGAAPRGIGTADVAPADYVAAALVEVTRQPESAGRAFHYPNPRPTPWDRLFDGAEAAGFPLERVEYPEWRERLLAEVTAGRENALAAFLPLLPDVDGAEQQASAEAEALAAERVALSGRRGDDDTNTRAALEGTGIECPRLDEALVRTYLDYFVETGFLEAPAGVGA